MDAQVTFAPELPRDEFPGRDQVGWWLVSYFDADGRTQKEEVYGRLAMQDNNVVIMDPATRGIKWGIPSVNAGPVRPVAGVTR